MAGDGTIYTYHWLYTAGSSRCLHISNLIAKVIQLDGARSEAAAAAAADRKRVVYETEWQVVGSHAALHAGQAAAGGHPPRRPVFVLSHPGAAAVEYAMPRPAQSGAGATEAAGAAFDTISAPGALEIPAMAAIALDAAAAQGRPYDGLATLGCVIRGETYHFEIVAGESARGIMALTMDGVAIGNGILTVENETQALVRADPKQKDKGGEAAKAAIALLELKNRFG